MKQGLLFIAAAFAMSTLLFAQDSDITKMETSVTNIIKDAATASSEPVTEEKSDTNDSEKKVPSHEK
jgi:hypothetical protein